MDSQTKELSEFCGVLWREREIVERVLYKIVVQQLVLNTGQTLWLPQANTEIELAVNDLRVVEVMRNAEFDTLATRMGLAAGASLAELAAIAPEPWGSILGEHRDALRELTAEIERTAQENRALITVGGTQASQAPA
jgi:hypothetical protein